MYMYMYVRKCVLGNVYKTTVPLVEDMFRALSLERSQNMIKTITSNKMMFVYLEKDNIYLAVSVSLLYLGVPHLHYL